MDDLPVLAIKNLKTYFNQKRGVVRAVDDISLEAYKGEITAIVGESGSGKSVTSMSILNLIEEPGKIQDGKIFLNGRDIMLLREKELMKIRGKEVSMIFQDPSSAMNPIIKVKKQLIESMRIHDKKTKKRILLDRCDQMLRKVGLRDTHKIMESYPFELSGGMCQRVMIAMALLSKPDLLIADEPTTALDLTIQASILDELVRLKNEEKMAIILITHDLGVVAQTADKVYVMHHGKIMEHGTVFEVFENPQHSYTKALLAAVYQ
ncbi:MAG: ABC transporter ATP-binding protein [Clostridiales bacterium]|nr:ABC transporter ATP-binding protein [Clostridiales bacterium]